ncbi:hypothetical protein GE300_03390 [Rhodobacteraceae bacterium 2CG4]|uniref:Excalibur calcium-binding domain-containing protein n=1 Tax=Halovulum marinum TaxID=2662447 RepID=A0A6L5YWC0_9RHOB|nr:hypothetical protein [Halovulum marinum]MSU88663.1 hypothetical protein [Halovulum marinum]
MKHLMLLVAGAAVLSACNSTVPAGGQGYFDPPPPAPLPGFPAYPDYPAPQAGTNAPQSQPGTAVAGAPRSSVAVDPDPNSQLARDVTDTLRATAPSGAATAQPPLPGPAAGVQAAPGSAAAMPGTEDIGINPNDESINLSLSTQEEQKRQREAAERRRQAAQSQLVIVEPEPVPQVDVNANVVAFARETTHPLGTKVYNRPVFRDRRQSASVCRRFESNEEAQRQFLANGGPNTDRYNLDPDGDGFACDFDPEKYRRLNF